MDVLASLKDALTKVKVLTVDNHIFRLHYRLTVIIILAFSILVTSRQYIGDPIDCTSPDSKIRQDLIDQYCWVSSTITLPKAFHQKVGKEVIAHGVDKQLPGDEVILHQYYQWVCFVLFIQAMMFYLPHFLWKTWEGGRIKALTSDLEGPLVNDDVKKNRIEALTAYFQNSLNGHTFYVARYSICEILNFINVIGQMFITNRFLGGTFLTYGTEVVSFSQLEQSNRTDPMIMVFPRVTKCTFHIIGPGGDPQNKDSICVLPVNIINEKIYIVLWFWFIVLAILSGLALFYRLATALSAQVRYQLLKTKASSVSQDLIETISMNTTFGDWFLVYMLSKNVNSYVFKDVAQVLAKLIDNNVDTLPKKQNLYPKYAL